MNTQTLVLIIGAVLGSNVITALIAAYYSRPKMQADSRLSDANAEKLKVDVYEKTLLLMNDAVERLEREREKWTKEREKWIAELAVKQAIWEEKERRLAQENADLRAAIRAGSIERRSMMSTLHGIEEQIGWLKVAMEAMEPKDAISNIPPSKDSIDESQK